MKKSKGMLTLEAALVMPLVICTVFVMIFSFLLIYSRIYVALTTNHVTSLATSQWYSIGSDFDISNREGGSVIGNAIGTSLSNKEKAKVIEEKIKNRINANSPMKIDPIQVTVKPMNYIIGQRVDVIVKATYKLPLSGLFKMLGMSSDGKVTTTYVKTINLSNNEDSMRTISYAKKLIQQSGFDKILTDMKKALSGVSK